MRLLTRITVLALAVVACYWFLTEVARVPAGVAVLTATFVSVASWYLYGRRVL